MHREDSRAKLTASFEAILELVTVGDVTNTLSMKQTQEISYCLLGTTCGYHYEPKRASKRRVLASSPDKSKQQVRVNYKEC